MCVVLEQLDSSLAEFCDKVHSQASQAQCTMDYSMSDEEADLSLIDEHSVALSQSQRRKARSQLSCIVQCGQNGMGLSVELVRIIGF